MTPTSFAIYGLMRRRRPSVGDVISYLLLTASTKTTDRRGAYRVWPSCCRGQSGGHSHVLVTSRLFPLIPDDVAADHPLRTVDKVLVSPSDQAAELEQRAHQDLEALLSGADGDNLASDLLGVLAAARGPLRAADMAALVRLSDPKASLPRVERAIRQEVGRVLAPTSRGKDPRLIFAHDTLRERAEQAFGAELRNFEELLHKWAREWSAMGWPMGKVPAYLLDTYPALLLADSLERLDWLYGDSLT